MTRALRPDGIKWPEDDTGKPTNRLELLSKINNLEHTKAHDALSDVEATIGMAKLINDNNSKLFIYLLGMRNKTKVGELVNSGDPFVYTSGKYSGEFNHTTVVEKLSDHPQHQGALVYDLRIDPLKFVDLTPEELAELWTWNEDRTIERLPVKTLQLHRCPVVAPLSVINSDNAWDRLGLNLDQVSKNRKILKEHSDFSDKLIAALRILDKQRDTSHTTTKTSSVDAQLYEGFFDNYDRQEMNIVRSETTEKLCASTPTFHDGRLSNLLPLYLARNYPNKASKEVINTWRTYVANYLLSGGATSRLKTYMTELEDKKLDKSVGDREKNLLNSLELWAKLVEKTGSVENESAT
jgi:exodeoxyribonuclease-1